MPLLPRPCPDMTRIPSRQYSQQWVALKFSLNPPNAQWHEFHLRCTRLERSVSKQLLLSCHTDKIWTPNDRPAAPGATRTRPIHVFNKLTITYHLTPRTGTTSPVWKPAPLSTRGSARTRPCPTVTPPCPTPSSKRLPMYNPELLRRYASWKPPTLRSPSSGPTLQLMAGPTSPATSCGWASGRLPASVWFMTA